MLIETDEAEGVMTAVDERADLIRWQVKNVLISSWSFVVRFHPDLPVAKAFWGNH